MNQERSDELIFDVQVYCMWWATICTLVVCWRHIFEVAVHSEILFSAHSSYMLTYLCDVYCVRWHCVGHGAHMKWDLLRVLWWVPWSKYCVHSVIIVAVLCSSVNCYLLAQLAELIV